MQHSVGGLIRFGLQATPDDYISPNPQAPPGGELEATDIVWLIGARLT